MLGGRQKNVPSYQDVVGLQCQLHWYGHAQLAILKERHEDLPVLVEDGEVRVIVVKFFFIPLEDELDRGAVVFHRGLAKSYEGEDVVHACAVLDALLKVVCAGFNEGDSQLVVAHPTSLLEGAVQLALFPAFHTIREGGTLLEVSESLKEKKKRWLD